MNTSSPYDQLLAAKLDQVPVPDMADSIWQAIDTQLGAPADAPPQKPVQKFTGKGWYGVLGTVTVVTLLWWGYKQMNHTPPHQPPQEVLPVTKDSSTTADSNTIINAVKKRTSPAKPVTVTKDSISLQGIPGNGAVVDSPLQQALPPVHIDSSLFHINSIPLPHIDSVSIHLPPGGKKPKGVKGITNDDYKITATKDSTGKH